MTAPRVVILSRENGRTVEQEIDLNAVIPWWYWTIRPQWWKAEEEKRRAERKARTLMGFILGGGL